MRVRLLVLMLVAFLPATSLDAHESRPGYLQLTLTDGETVNLLLKIPALGNMRLGLYPDLPANCELEGTPTSYIVDNAYSGSDEHTTHGCSRDR